MAIDMKGCSNKERETERGLTITRLAKFIKEVGPTEESKAMAFVLGLMEKSMMANGKITKSMEMGPTLGRTEGFTKETIETIKNMDMVLTSGQMEGSILVSGKTIKDMGKVCM